MKNHLLKGFLASHIGGGVKKWSFEDFPGPPVVKTSRFSEGDMGSIPGQATEIPHAMWYGQRERERDGLSKLSGREEFCTQRMKKGWQG